MARGVRKLLAFITNELVDFDPSWVKLKFVRNVPSEVVLASTYMGDEEARASSEEYLFTDGRKYQAGKIEDEYTRLVKYRIRDASWVVTVREEKISISDMCSYPVMTIVVYGNEEIMRKIEGVLREYKCEYTIIN